MADGILAQFKKFLIETNAMALAFGIVIGGAVTKLIGTLVSGLIMPIVTLALPGGDWRAWAFGIGSQQVKVGEILGATIDFLIISFVVYVAATKIFKVEVKK
jgi:large conductance mechanosensitive channel